MLVIFCGKKREVSLRLLLNIQLLLWCLNFSFSLLVFDCRNLLKMNFRRFIYSWLLFVWALFRSVLRWIFMSWNCFAGTLCFYEAEVWNSIGSTKRFTSFLKSRSLFVLIHWRYSFSIRCSLGHFELIWFRNEIYLLG